MSEARRRTSPERIRELAAQARENDLNSLAEWLDDKAKEAENDR